MPELTGRSVLVFVGEDYEDLEVWYPVLRLREAGAKVVIAGLKAGVMHKGKHGYPCPVETTVEGLSARDFAAVVCPGGWMPDKVRRDENVKRLVREFHEQKKVIAAVCHGGWIPISAGVYKGVKVTGSPGIKDDLVNAGAIWEDAAVVIDRHFVSSRKPDDLPDFCRGIFSLLVR